MKKIPVGVLGATGSVGQKFIEMLIDHPWFELTALAASEKSAGKSYRQAANWFMPTLLPDSIGNMKVQLCEPNLPCKIVFSGLDSSVAGDIETKFAEAGYTVISNARNHRMRSDVPLIIPEVNSGHLKLMEKQKTSGKIITNPNCCVIGLAIALKPLQTHFGIEKVHVVTMQAISGAGYPGVASLDISDNVVPYIGDEEEKIETETQKILGSYNHHSVTPASMTISAHCNRVPVVDGHMACVSVKLAKKATKEELIRVWKEFKTLALPTAPKQAIYYMEQNNYPQTRLHRNLDKGMAVSVGRLRPCSLFDYKFVILSHNTIRGAAGGSLLIGEALLQKGT